MANIFVFYAFSMNNLLSVRYNTELILISHVHSYCTVSQTKFRQEETVSLGGFVNKHKFSASVFEHTVS